MNLWSALSVYIFVTPKLSIILNLHLHYLPCCTNITWPEVLSENILVFPETLGTDASQNLFYIFVCFYYHQEKTNKQTNNDKHLPKIPKDFNISINIECSYKQKAVFYMFKIIWVHIGICTHMNMFLTIDFKSPFFRKYAGFFSWGDGGPPIRQKFCQSPPIRHLSPFLDQCLSPPQPRFVPENLKNLNTFLCQIWLLLSSKVP